MQAYEVGVGIKMLEAIEQGNLVGKPPKGGNPGRRVWFDGAKWHGGAVDAVPPEGMTVFYWVGSMAAWRRFSGASGRE